MTHPTTADKGELLPCPFCGEQPTQDDVGSYFVQCPECGVEGPYGSPDAEESAAIAAWNRRPTNEGQDGLTDEDVEDWALYSSDGDVLAINTPDVLEHEYMPKHPGSAIKPHSYKATAIARHLSSKQAMRPGNAPLYDPNDVAFPKGFMPVESLPVVAYVVEGGHVIMGSHANPGERLLTDHATATAEIAKRDADVSFYLNKCKEYEAEIFTLRAQLAEAQKDAAPYRFLLEKNRGIDFLITDKLDGDQLVGADLDTAIRSEMAKQN